MYTNFWHHQFHKESMPELNEFLNLARKSPNNHLSNALKTCLPVNKELLHSINSNVNYIDLTGETCTNATTNGVLTSISLLNEDENNQDQLELDTQLNISGTTEDPIDVIKESLLNESNDHTSLIMHLVNGKIQAVALMESLFPVLAPKEVQKLGILICSSQEDIDDISEKYLTCLLLPMINKVHSEHLQEIFAVAYRKYHRNSQVCEKTNSFLLDGKPTFLQNISKIKSKEKDLLLSNFITSISVLKRQHIKSLENLLNPDTNIHNIRKILGLIAGNSEELSGDSAVGKIIIGIVNVLGRNVRLVEQSLKEIIQLHTSPWKSKSEKLFNTHLETGHLSQSIIKY